MQTLPKVAIVGRPNVGKSSVFNWLAGRRIAIVDPTAGVTRDRVATLIEAEGSYFELSDTGGMGIQDRDALTDDIEKQIAIAMNEAAVILFVVDGRDGIVPLDEEVVRRLRAVSKPIIHLANKCDYPEMDPAAQHFRKFGFEPFLCVSAHQKRNRDELLREIVRRLPPKGKDETPGGN